ncbi:MAG: hypothetical protein GXO47_09280 [Chlorobi bacterium]|nr:hypothetical protein [Chlorobiota bacterium]
MEEMLWFYARSILIIYPSFLLIIRIIFKKSILARIGYIMVTAVILATLATSTIEHLGWHKAIGIPIRITVIIAALYTLKNEIKILKDISNSLQEIADFDLSVKVNDEYLKRKDEFGLLASSLHKMATKLKGIVHKIQINSKQLSYTSEQLSSASQQISQGATEQASTTEEISSSIEELIATIESNTDKARHTNELSSKSAQMVNDAYEIFKKTILSINEIAGKVKIIADISQKTNMLALNAAVEAARAGHEGKGFAVVANEVKKLADNSKQALSSIEKITNSSLEVSHIAEDKFKNTVPGILKSAELVKDIAEASSEQLSGAELINSAIQQLTQVTNQNSVSAEEMSATSEELATRAQEMNNIISTFKVDKN